MVCFFFPKGVRQPWRGCFTASVASPAHPYSFLTRHFIAHGVFDPTAVPVSRCLFPFAFRLLCADASMLVFPHPSVLVKRLIRPIDHAAGDLLPAFRGAYEVPCQRLIDATTNQYIIGGVAELTGFAISRWRFGASGQAGLAWCYGRLRSNVSFPMFRKEGFVTIFRHDGLCCSSFKS